VEARRLTDDGVTSSFPQLPIREGSFGADRRGVDTRYGSRFVFPRRADWAVRDLRDLTTAAHAEGSRYAVRSRCPRTITRCSFVATDSRPSSCASDARRCSHERLDERPRSMPLLGMDAFDRCVRSPSSEPNASAPPSSERLQVGVRSPSQARRARPSHRTVTSLSPRPTSYAEATAVAGSAAARSTSRAGCRWRPHTSTPS
jgi:hypothetical protein